MARYEIRSNVFSAIKPKKGPSSQPRPAPEYFYPGMAGIQNSDVIIYTGKHFSSFFIYSTPPPVEAVFSEKQFANKSLNILLVTGLHKAPLAPA